MTHPAPAPATAGRRAPEPAPAGALLLEGAGRDFGACRALGGLSLAVRPGERVAVIGPSGAGKSTLLRLAAGSLFASSGRVLVLGEEVARLGPARLRALRARVGTVHQQLHLVPQASVLENVLMGRLGRRSWLAVAAAPLRRAERIRVAEVLDQVGIADKLHERLDRLSGGEQQRVAVARVLHQDPELVVADEPFSAVDPERSAQVVRLLVEAARGRTLLLATHQLEPVFPHFPRVVGLRGGKLLFDRRREEVTPDDLARLYQPEGATASPEPRQLLAPSGPAIRAEVRVGASSSPGEYLLPRALPAFARELPGVRVRLEVKDTLEVLSDLAAGRVELAFVGARSPHPALHFEDFAEDEIVLVAAPDLPCLPRGPISPSAAARLPRVDREPGSATRAIVEAQFAALGAPLDPGAAAFEAGSIEALKSAVAGGMGVGFASRLSVAEELRSGRLLLVPVASVRVPRRFFVAWRRAEPPSAAARALLAAARHAIAGLAP
jgi:phosphonate transport system ATP-binding protein